MGESNFCPLPQHLSFTPLKSTGQIHVSCDLNVASDSGMNLAAYLYPLSTRRVLQIKPQMSCHKLDDALKLFALRGWRLPFLFSVSTAHSRKDFYHYK